MPIYRWRPMSDVYQVQNEMKRLFDQYFGSEWEEGEQVRATWNPLVDVVELENEILLVAELPGVDKEHIKISVNNGVLSLSGEKKLAENEKKDCYHCSERFFGPFERVFNLPATVNESKIKADFKDGLLKISLPKTEAAKPREIQIAG
ncbi:Hsp20/alpha crystallin family protein [candidate division KSB1 bacterium]|nr:Hsp20/alpha crystallin family protein [candidate division KSB1 bacterium]